MTPHICSGDDTTHKVLELHCGQGRKTEADTNGKANKDYATFPSVIMLNNSLPCTLAEVWAVRRVVMGLPSVMAMH